MCLSIFHCIGVLNLLAGGIFLPRHCYILLSTTQNFVTLNFTDHSIHPFIVTHHISSSLYLKSNVALSLATFSVQLYLLKKPPDWPNYSNNLASGSSTYFKGEPRYVCGCESCSTLTRGKVWYGNAIQVSTLIKGKPNFAKTQPYPATPYRT
jgi:hypothetical protein